VPSRQSAGIGGSRHLQYVPSEEKAGDEEGGGRRRL
jgi:hypothetical protein